MYFDVVFPIVQWFRVCVFSFVVCFDCFVWCFGLNYVLSSSSSSPLSQKLMAVNVALYSSYHTHGPPHRTKCVSCSFYSEYFILSFILWSHVFPFAPLCLTVMCRQQATATATVNVSVLIHVVVFALSFGEHERANQTTKKKSKEIVKKKKKKTPNNI